MNIRRWGITLFLCLTLFAGLSAFKVLEIKQAIAFGEAFPEHSESIEIAISKPLEYTPSIKALGTIVAPQTLEIRNELSGNIVNVNFKSGDHVEKNQILIQLDSNEERAQLTAAQARVVLANSVYQRTLNLHKNNSVSDEALDTAKAELAAQQAETKILNNIIRKKNIRAPFSGIAGLHHFEVGQVLLDNTLITTLVGQQDYVWVDFSVPQFYPALKTGSLIQVSSLAVTSANTTVENQASIPAVILAQNTVIDTRSRSRQYRARINSTNHAFTANATIELQVPINEPQDLIAVPVTAIQHDQLGQYVYVLVKDDIQLDGFRAQRQQINVATHQDGFALLSKGLNSDLQVAAAGAFKLHPGILVYENVRPNHTPALNNTLLGDQDSFDGGQL